MKIATEDLELTICRGIKNFDDIMIIAEYLDHPDTKHDEMYETAYSVLENFVVEASDPHSDKHELLLATEWRSIHVKKMANKHF